MSDDEEVASDVPPRYLFFPFLFLFLQLCYRPLGSQRVRVCLKKSDFLISFHCLTYSLSLHFCSSLPFPLSLCLFPCLRDSSFLRCLRHYVGLYQFEFLKSYLGLTARLFLLRSHAIYGIYSHAMSVHPSLSMLASLSVCLSV